MEKTALKASPSINTDLMSVTEIHDKLQEGYKDIEAGKIQDAVSAFAKYSDIVQKDMPLCIRKKCVMMQKFRMDESAMDQ